MRSQKRIAATQIGKAVTPAVIADQGISQLDHLSANLAGAHSIVAELADFEASVELVHLLYLIEFAQEYADKVRGIFDESVRKLRPAASARP